mmetsp:Transcript_103628/g.288488  ORF Transcript_103628/g.288488 Transcript_103628/m.288488 type:complete len:650 (-) Transcript_103628:172-2121(-)
MSQPAPTPSKAPPPGKAPPPCKAPAPGKAPPLGKAGPPRPKAPGAGKAPPQRPGGVAACAAFSGPKLRPLFWTVAQAPPQSVWIDLVPPAPFDQAQLERQFALGESRPPAVAPVVGRSARPPSCDEARKRLRVLDDRTSQLLAIAFNRLPPPERLVGIFDSLEDFPEVLPTEAVLALNAAAVEQHEPIEQLRQLGIPSTGLSQLDLPERYLWVLASEPSSMVKLACGALLVGPARELRELRLSFQKVGVCCQALRSSELVQKCVSTSLAVGNFMNRGTSRSGANAVLLPESLLKLDELRGVAEAPQDAGEGRARSLLDFVAQALVDEAGTQPMRDLKAEAEDLRGRVRAAQKVSLEEAEASVNQICAAAAKAQKGLAEMARSNGVARLAERVAHVCDEADVAVRLVKAAKEELTLTQQWSSAKSKAKGDEWFAGWLQFLDQLTQAFARAGPPPLRPLTPTAAAAAPEVAPAAPLAPATVMPVRTEAALPPAAAERPALREVSANNSQQLDACKHFDTWKHQAHPQFREECVLRTCARTPVQIGDHTTAPTATSRLQPFARTPTVAGTTPAALAQPTPRRAGSRGCDAGGGFLDDNARAESFDIGALLKGGPPTQSDKVAAGLGGAAPRSMDQVRKAASRQFDDKENLGA